MDYHAPTDCSTIKKWLTKCADDSETANYISAHTKDVRCSECMYPSERLPHKTCPNSSLSLYGIVSSLPYMYRKEWRLQPYAVLQLQTRVLLDVLRRLEGPWIRIL